MNSADQGKQSYPNGEMPLSGLRRVPAVIKPPTSLLDRVSAPVEHRDPRPSAPHIVEQPAQTMVDLRLDDIQELAHVTADAAGRSGTPFGTYLFRPTDPGADLARHVEGGVFDEVFGYSPHTTNAEYGPYERSTVFVCVLDHRRSLPVGAIRLVLPGGPGFKSLDDTARSWGHHVDTTASGIDVASDPLWDIATLSVAPGYRTGLISSALYQSTCTLAQRCGVRWFVTVIDVAVLRLLQRTLRRPFTPFPGFEPRDCVGSISLPCFSDVPAWAARLAHHDPTLHETIFGGVGLESAVSHPDWHRATHLMTTMTTNLTLATQPLPDRQLRPVA